MDIKIRRVRRTLLERLTLWERAYEARALHGQEEFAERAKTPEVAQTLLLRRLAEDGLAMANPQLHIEVRGDLIIIKHPPTQFFAVYAKSSNRSELVLKRRTDTGDNVLLVQVWQAANAKARELGWIA